MQENKRTLVSLKNSFSHFTLMTRARFKALDIEDYTEHMLYRYHELKLMSLSKEKREIVKKAYAEGIIREQIFQRVQKANQEVQARSNLLKRFSIRRAERSLKLYAVTAVVLQEKTNLVVLRVSGLSEENRSDNIRFANAWRNQAGQDMVRQQPRRHGMGK